MKARRGAKRFQRTDRVGELVREIVASELERIDDQRLFPVAITGVDVDNELERAVVYFDVLDPEDLPEAEAALAAHRHKVQRALGNQSRLHRTPTVEFTIDPAIGAATRIETILDQLGMGDTGSAGDAESGGDTGPEGEQP